MIPRKVPAAFVTVGDETGRNSGHIVSPQDLARGRRRPVFLARRIPLLLGAECGQGDLGRPMEGSRSCNFSAGADHVLFRLASLPAALAEAALGGPHPVLVSAYFSLFSVGLIFLIWAVSLRAGASEREALWSAFFGAASSSLFFYSRHFLPYDVALFTLFLALWFGLGGYSALNSAKVGGLVALGVLSYNGYWLLGFAVLGLHVLFGTGSAPHSASPRLLVSRGVLCGRCGRARDRAGVLSGSDCRLSFVFRLDQAG